MNKLQTTTVATFTKIATIMIALTAVSGVANAAVTLNVEDNVKVTAINGQAVNVGLFSKDNMQFTLQAGRHVITARYDRLYDLSRDKHDYVRSGNITINAQLNDNQTYQLVMPNQPERYHEAKKYAKHPTLAIKLGDVIVASQSQQVSSAGLLSGVGKKIGGVFNRDSAVNANTQVIAAINQGQPTNNQMIQAPVNSAVTNTSNAMPTGSTLDQFMQIWLKATPEERERIRGWVAK